MIDPIRDLGRLLLKVEKPARYTGGEFGRLARPGAGLTALAAFPDLYEIGMSNQAFRILYNRLNAIEGVSCDRAFAPAPDFEALLAEQNLPLYGLDTGIPLADTDLLLFTLGYELGITGVLSMLKAGRVPLRAAERTDGAPIVIMGGPCVSNPLPYGRFADAFWIGEAEAGFFELAVELRDLKREGKGRAALLEKILAHPSVWAAGKERAVKAVWAGFGRGENAVPPVFPVPSMKIVQAHGAVEIMRGCPNGCRFCHAGYWYRPMRQKDAAEILRETEAFVRGGGYREISLSSLSTGDYRHIGPLVGALNGAFAASHVSFQLPSLKVSTFSLPLLEKVALVRKSGLTFAVETPLDAWQMAVNKEVSRQSVVDIIAAAKKNGWRGAKFYFMIGLPLPAEAAAEGSEEAEIVAFVRHVAAAARMNFNINVGVFVPKPHTPYQNAPQMDVETARKKLRFIKDELKKNGHKVSYQDPFISRLEGLICRGGEEAGAFIEAAFDRGCRLDAWAEYIDKDIWKEVLADYTEPDITARPWSVIRSGVSDAYLNRELERSKNAEFTLPCTEKCTHPCGSCGDRQAIVQNSIHDEVNSTEKTADAPPAEGVNRLVFSFSKTGKAVFLSHLSLIEVFSMAFLRAGIPVSYTEGFNPLPRLEIVSPLSIGIEGWAEIACIETETLVPGETFTEAMNRSLPEGLLITRAANYRVESGQKKYSLSAIHWGFTYLDKAGAEVSVKLGCEKQFRLDNAVTDTNWGLVRAGVLAFPPGEPNAPADYFEVLGKFNNS